MMVSNAVVTLRDLENNSFPRGYDRDLLRRPDSRE